MIKRTVFIAQITDNVLKAIKCAGNGRKDFTEITVNPSGEKALQALQKIGYRNHPLILSLPRNQATCRQVALPAESAQEIAKIAPLQAPRYLPYPLDELITGYQVISTRQDGYSNVNLVIVHRNVISRYLEFLKGLNLKKFSVVLSSYGLCNLYNYLYPQENSPVMLIDLDFNQAELAIISAKKMVFSRYFKLDHAREDWKFTFLEEVNRSREAYAKELSADAPRKILLLGESQAAQDCCSLLKEKIPLEVEQAAFYKKIGLTAPEYSFASLIGLGLAHTDESLSLLLPELKQEGRRLKVYQKNLKNLSFAAVLVLIWALAIARSLDNKAKYLAHLKAEVAKIAKEAKPLEEIEKRSGIMVQQNAKRILSLDLLTGCFKALPNSAYLTDFNYEEAGQLILRGQAPELDQVFSFVSQLQNLPQLQKFNIKVNYASKRNIKEGEMVEFEIACKK